MRWCILDLWMKWKVPAEVFSSTVSLILSGNPGRGDSESLEISPVMIIYWNKWCTKQSEPWLKENSQSDLWPPHVHACLGITANCGVILKDSRTLTRLCTSSDILHCHPTERGRSEDETLPKCRRGFSNDTSRVEGNRPWRERRHHVRNPLSPLCALTF